MARKAEAISSSETHADAAHRRLEEMIVTLQLPPGSRWSEQGLAERIGIGRTPVREAVKRLQDDYLVSILPRHGLMITEIKTHEQMLAVEFRRELEIFISVRAARRIMAADRAHLLTVADEIEAAGKKGSFEKYLREVFKANSLIAKAAGNPFAAKSISPLHAISRRFHYKYEADLPNLGTMGKLHAERARAVSNQDEQKALANVVALMDQIESYTRKIFEVSIGSN